MNVYSIHFDELDYNKYNFSLFKTYMVYKYISFLTLKPQHYISNNVFAFSNYRPENTSTTSLANGYANAITRYWMKPIPRMRFMCAQPMLIVRWQVRCRI